MAGPPEDDRKVTLTDVDAPVVDIADARRDEPVPPPVPAAREARPRATRSIPPPPPGRRSPPVLLANGKRESPTVLERAIAAGPETDDARIKRLEAELAAAGESADLACVAHELGEQLERRGDPVRAIAAYRRAVSLHPALKPARWALRRLFRQRSQWSDLAALIDSEIDADSESHERVDLLLERALVPSPDKRSAMSLDIATKLVPRHHGALLELERVVARELAAGAPRSGTPESRPSERAEDDLRRDRSSGRGARAADKKRLLDVLEKLAEAFDHPQHQVAYSLEAARVAVDYERARTALTAAARKAAVLPARLAQPAALRIAREWLRIASVHRAPDLADALESLAQALSGEREHEAIHLAIGQRREVVALRRLQAQQVRSADPQRAWGFLEQAATLCPDEPVVLVDQIELACELGRHTELPRLVDAWHRAETESGRLAMISWWCAERFGGSWRTLHEALAIKAPVFVLLTAAAECDALADVAKVGGCLKLANTYLAAARGAHLGTWTGPGAAVEPDVNAAVALYVQAAELLAYYARPPHLDQAHDALAKALEIAPAHPAVVEASIDLDDATGTGDQALARLREMASTSPDAPAVLERALRIAYEHQRPEEVLRLQRELVVLEPERCAPAWWLDSLLAQAGRNAERAEVLAGLADDSDPDRRATALLGAARLQARYGSASAATDLYRRLVEIWPQDPFPRDALIDLLRAQDRWDDVVAERLVQASADEAATRRALREAAWVLEVRIADIKRAAEVYAEWASRFPQDRTPLEGVARCAAALGDHRTAADARETIASLDRSPEAAWLYAHALERADRLDEAVELYRRANAGEALTVASASAALALYCLSMRDKVGDPVAAQVEAAEVLARRTTDTQLVASLLEATGWMYLIALDELDRAAEAFAAAAERTPTIGCALGAALVAACKADQPRLVAAYAELTNAIEAPELAAALHMRAAMNAYVGGNSALAYERLEAARGICPDNLEVMFASAELEPPARPETSDPFAGVEVLLARAAILESRAALADDPEAHASWQLDRAEALELAGQLREATAVVAAVFQKSPTNRRAVEMIRRIAKRAGDFASWAHASFALALLSRAPALQLRLLRDAYGIYDGSGPTSQKRFAMATLRRIVALDPGAPEAESLLQRVRDGGDDRATLHALTERLTYLVSETEVDVPRVKALLVERARVLIRLNHAGAAAADLDAVLVHSPDHAGALRLRADIARQAGDNTRAITLWQRYLSIDVALAPTARIEVERLVAAAQSKTEPRAIVRAPDPTTNVRIGEESVTSSWGDVTDPEAVTMPPSMFTDDVVTPMPRRAITQPVPVVTPPRRPITQPVPIQPETDVDMDAFEVQTVLADPFGGDTMTMDISHLQEEERRIARTSQPPPFAGATTSQMAAEPPPPPAPVERATSVTETATQARPLRVPPIEIPELMAQTRPVGLEPTLDPLAVEFSEASGLEDSAALVVSLDQLQPERLEAPDQMLAECERELELGEDPVLRIEAAELCELLGNADRAREHYEAALLAEPRTTAALSGLRRIAHRRGDLAEVVRLVEAELAVAGPREKDPLLRYRIHLLMAMGEQDLARVAVGELLDRAPQDLASLVTQLELAVVDHRTTELATALERLAVVPDPALRGVLQYMRAVLAIHQEDPAGAADWLRRAIESDPAFLAARLGVLCEAAARRDTAADPGGGLLELASQVEKEDPIMAAALAMRAHEWAGSGDRATSTLAAQLAVGAAGRDSLVARFAAETALDHISALPFGNAARAGGAGAFDAGDHAIASHAFARWARCGASAVERGYAAARAAELDPARLARLWTRVLELDVDDDYATSRLRASHHAAEDRRSAIDLDLELARATGRIAPLLRAVDELIREHHLADAIDALARERERSKSTVITDILAEVLADAGRWTERAAVLGELVAAPGPLAADILQIRLALARDAIVRASSATAPKDEIEKMAVAALEVWDAVIDRDPGAPIAHTAALSLARRIGDTGIMTDALARARGVERTPWAAATLGLRHARLLVESDPSLARELAREATTNLDDPRCTLVAIVGAAHRRELRDAAAALEDRAASLPAGTEAMMLRVRAAHVWLAADDPARAVALLAPLAEKLPWLGDVLDVARRRAGAATAISTEPARIRPLTFARLVHEADRAAAQNDLGAALALYREAVERHPVDRLVTTPLLRVANELRDATAMVALAQEQLHNATEVNDLAGVADANELLARVERDLRDDADAARGALAGALQADPQRIDLALELERDLAVADRFDELLALRAKRIDLVTAAEYRQDRVALLLDRAELAARARRPDAELATYCREVLALDPHTRRMLIQLESIMRSGGKSDELAAFEEQLADYFDDPRAKAAALTRAGQTLASLGKPAEAVKRFARAADLVATYAPALDAWHDTALANELWVELADVATRKAAIARDTAAAGALHHFAGVVLMDKARATEAAVTALQMALAADPGQLDALVRLRVLLAATKDHDAHVAMLRDRLANETDPASRVELHRMLADVFHNHGNREDAMRQYRAMLAIDPKDTRAHAALVDLSTDQSQWRDAADAVLARIAIENDVIVIRALNRRLGAIYGDREPMMALGALRAALEHDHDDKDALVQLADLAIRTSEWQIALDACDRLVAIERDPDTLAAHLRRASMIYGRGFGDRARAESMLLAALAKAPTNIELLQLLTNLYNESGDPSALRARVAKLAAAMRTRIAEHPKDGPAYRMLAHTLGSRPAAAAAAELAKTLGATSDIVEHLVVEQVQADGSPVPEIETLFAGSREPEVRRLLQLLAEPIAKHVGIDIAVHGVGRKERLRPTDPSAVIASQVGAAMGFEQVAVYVTRDAPHAMVAEPTTPPSLVLGSAIVGGDPAGVQYAAAAALWPVHASLGIPARLSSEELGVLAWAVLRLLHPGLAVTHVDEAAVDAEAAALRRLVPPALLDKGALQAAAIKAFDYRGLARDLRVAELRAGYVATGRMLPGLTILATGVGTNLHRVLGDPVVRGLIEFALRDREDDSRGRS